MARQNQRGLVLSFKRSGSNCRGRWYSRVGGKIEYFGWGNGVTDRQSYNAALASFLRRQEQMQSNAVIDSRGQEPEQLVRGGMTWRNLDAANQAWAASILEAHSDASEAEQRAKGVTNVNELLTLFLADQKLRNDGRHFMEAQKALGKRISESKNQYLSDARYVSIQRDASSFRKVVGEMAWDQSESVAEKVSRAWRNHVESLFFNEQIKAHTFNERIKFARMFMGWAETTYRLDRLPRSKKALFAVFATEPNAKSIPLPIIHQLWKAAGERERAFIAMGLNFGFYSKDISNLKADMIDGDYIAHERGKTGVKVRYKMWNVTKQLIEATRTSVTGRVYSSGSGKPLNYYPHESMSRVDIVRNDFFRLCYQLGIKGFSFSNVRDTSSTHVENFDKSLTDLFDCHKDNRMARYYVDGAMVDTSALDRAIDHLEAIYGLRFDEPREVPPRKARSSKSKPSANVEIVDYADSVPREVELGV